MNAAKNAAIRVRKRNLLKSLREFDKIWILVRVEELLEVTPRVLEAGLWNARIRQHATKNSVAAPKTFEGGWEILTSVPT